MCACLQVVFTGSVCVLVGVLRGPIWSTVSRDIDSLCSLGESRQAD